MTACWDKMWKIRYREMLKIPFHEFSCNAQMQWRRYYDSILDHFPTATEIPTTHSFVIPPNSDGIGEVRLVISNLFHHRLIAGP